MGKVIFEDKMQTIEIREYSEKDIPAMCGIWNEVVEDGVAFPQDETLTQTEAESFFCRADILCRSRGTRK